MIHLDSAFVIDLLRESRAQCPGPAFDFIESLPGTEIVAISVLVLCELRAGAELSRQPLRELEGLDEVVGGVLVVYPDDRFAPAYGRAFAAIQRSGRRISAMDLLIGTAALLDDAPVVSRNVKDFSRVPGLRVLTY